MAVPASLLLACVTRGETPIWSCLAAMHALALRISVPLLWIVDGDQTTRTRIASWAPGARILPAGDNRYDTLEAALTSSIDDYVFILDDDEQITPTLAQWLQTAQFTAAPRWRTPRAWLWGDARHRLQSPGHWPDYQVRLCRRTDIKIPRELHGGWFGLPSASMPITPGAITHYKLLLRTRAERQATLASYDAVKDNSGFASIYLPDAAPDAIAWTPI